MKIHPRVLVRVVAGAIIVVLVAWQWWGSQHPPVVTPSAVRNGASASASASAAAKPARAMPPATLRLGPLTLTACAVKAPHSAVTTPAFCANFPVPENRADPKSRAIELRLALIKSPSQVPESDLVVYLAGGPGQSAIQSYAELQPAFAPLLRRHDVLLLDQRGTGDSHPLRCPAVEKQIEQLASAAAPAQRAELVGKCAQEVEKTADPRYYTTTDAVADLEAVRVALGAPKLDLVGVSYGTRVAQHYATAHPDAVRSIVLDGVVPNQLVLGETFAATLRRALQLQAAACSAAPACKKAFGDWQRTLLRLYANLKAEPAQAVTIADPYTYQPVVRSLDADTLAAIARFFAYSSATSALLPLAIHEAARGNYAPLLGQAQLLTSDLSESMQGGMQLSVICTEDAPLLKPRPQDAGTLLGGALLDAFMAECKAWPHGPMPQHFHAPFHSAIPTLLISGERDPVTPPSFAAEVLPGLANGRSLVAKGLGHAEAINTGCVPHLVAAFIDKLQPKQLDASCVKRIGAVPAFVDFNGAAP